MFVVRYILLPLIFIFTVLALVGTVPLPLYQKELGLGQEGKIQVTLWEWQPKGVKTSPDVAGNRVTVPNKGVRFNYARCRSLKYTFRAMQAFSIAGTVFGFYALLISCLQCFCKLKVKLPLFLFLIFAFVCELVLVILVGVSFGTTFCRDTTNGKQRTFTDEELEGWKLRSEYHVYVVNISSATTAEFKGNGYKITSAFIIQIVACAGYLICVILAPFTQQLWCGKC